MYQEFKLVAGHLKERKGRYYVVVSYTDTTGKRISQEFSTGLPVKGNKKKADDILQRIRREESEKLYTQRRMQSGGETIDTTTRFTQFLSDWLEMMRASVESTTFSSYSMTIRNKVIPYFDKRFPKLKLIDVTPKHIQDYYTYELNVCGVSANTVIHRHANIRKALDYAYKTGMIESNPADRV